MVILDSDHLSLLERENPLVAQIIANNLRRVSPLEVCTTIVNFEEQMRGWLAVLAKCKNIELEVEAYARLQNFLKRYAGMNVLDFDSKAAKHFQYLKSLKLRVGTMDLKIAAIALAHDALLLTRNLRDFENIPNFKVEDWTIEQAGENQ